MKKVYIAGPISGDPDYMVKFLKAERAPEVQGLKVLNPATILREFADIVSYEETMQACFALVRKSDAVCMLKGWEKSPGATAERRLAGELGKEIIYEH